MVSTGGRLTSTPSRRSVLAGAIATAGTAWVLDRFRGIPSSVSSTRVGFEIKTLPADEDPFAIRISRRIATWFREAGMDVSVLPVTGDELLRQVLLNNNYDVFVAQFPGDVRDPDALHALVHSAYAAEPGWQNPFGYSSLSTDEELERQRTADAGERREVIEGLEETIVEQNPFTVLAFPDRIAAHRSDRFTGMSRENLRRPRGYFSLERSDDHIETFRICTTDPRVTRNLNPLNPEYRQDGLITGFLYEPIAYWERDDIVPWLASEVEWLQRDVPTARVTLLEDATWHDGEEVTATDVSFTYAFLRDTTLDEREESVPVTRYRGRSSLVDDVEERDIRTVHVHFRDVSRAVARRALTVPILPEHIWRDRVSEVTGSGPGVTTEAIATNNVPALGSGPLQFEQAEEQQRLVLSRFEDHVSNREGASEHPARSEDGLPFEELVVRYVGSDASAVDLVARDEADATVANVSPDLVPRIGSHDEVTLDVTASGSFYFSGYNARRPPFSNTRFRALLGRLIDRAHLVESVFDGYATPAISPLARTDWGAPTLAWDETDAPFIGEDGVLDLDRVRGAFTDAGYRYDDRGHLYRN